MKTRILALLLAALTVLCLFAGCAKQETPAAEAPAEPAAEAPTAEAPAAEAPTTETPAAESVQPSAEPVLPETEAAGSAIEYPLAESADLEYWLGINSDMLNQYGLTSWNESQGVAFIQDTIGVNLTYTEVSRNASTEQFQLMIASGDWPDIVNASPYNGGLSQAAYDEVILDLSQLLPQYAPDYWNALQGSNLATIQAATTDGVYYSMYTLYSEYTQEEGCYYRGDWLQALDMDVPATWEEFLDYLYAAYDAYGCECTINVDSTGQINCAMPYYNTALFSLSSGSNDVAIYLDDAGQVASGMITDGYRAYLEQLKALHDDGIILNEFYSETVDQAATTSFVASGNMAAWTGKADFIATIQAASQDKNLVIQPAMRYFPGSDGVYDFLDAPALMHQNRYANICSDSENVEAALEFMNWFFTEDGLMYSTYGILDQTYTLDENGEPQFTNLILNDATGNSFNNIICIYTVTDLPVYQSPRGKMKAYTQQANEAIEIFSDLTNVTSDRDYPSAAALDTEEQESVTNLISDITSYAAERLLKMVIGAEELNDETWSDYVSTVNAMGLPQVVAVYQQAYDDYLVDWADYLD